MHDPLYQLTKSLREQVLKIQKYLFWKRINLIIRVFLYNQFLYANFLTNCELFYNKCFTLILFTKFLLFYNNFFTNFRLLYTIFFKQISTFLQQMFLPILYFFTPIFLPDFYFFTPIFLPNFYFFTTNLF